MGEVRLQKYLRDAGVASRRHSEELIAAGRVAVNGLVVTEMGYKVDSARDEIAVDGKAVEPLVEHATIVLNKPAGFITAMQNDYGKRCVGDLFSPDDYPGLYHIGRLDRDTTGVLLLTTDGKLGHELLHPSRHVVKEYLAQVEGFPTARELERIERGITIYSGEEAHECAPAEVQPYRRLPLRFEREDSCLEPGYPRTSFVLVRIHEGVKHQVKLMLGAIGHPVVRLHRTRFGPIGLEGLRLGEWCELSRDEMDSLNRLMR